MISGALGGRGGGGGSGQPPYRNPRIPMTVYRVKRGVLYQTQTVSWTYMGHTKLGHWKCSKFNRDAPVSCCRPWEIHSNMSIIFELFCVCVCVHTHTDTRDCPLSRIFISFPNRLYAVVISTIWLRFDCNSIALRAFSDLYPSRPYRNSTNNNNNNNIIIIIIIILKNCLAFNPRDLYYRWY